MRAKVAGRFPGLSRDVKRRNHGSSVHAMDETNRQGHANENSPERTVALAKMETKPVRASVIDVFSGVGGLAHGFKLEGFPLVCGIDVDEKCRHAFETNNDAPFYRRDVSRLRGAVLNKVFHVGVPRVLVGCAPCQPFSLYNQKNDDPQWKLLDEFARIIDEARPEVVSMENVPRLETFRGGSVLASFIETLKCAGYNVWYKPIYCPDYGIPQSRTRLVLLASRVGAIEMEPPTHGPDDYVTVKDAIGELPRLNASDIDPDDPLHRCGGLSPTNMERIKAAKPGGTWRDWSPDLVTECHRRETGRGYASVYGRMSWSEPSPTITTQYYGFGSGRFGHPEQDRAISLREGAILQTFPGDYEFTASGTEISFKSVGRMIGNAVPVLLSRVIARSIKRHLVEHPPN